MGMPAATIGVTHPFEVLDQTKVVAVIAFRDADANIGCCINGAADAETWGHLEMGGWPRDLCLGGGLCIPAAPLWWGCG